MHLIQGLRLVVCLLVSLSGILPLLAQPVQMQFEKIDIPNIHVDFYSAAMDADGFIWFGNYDGLYRYNGLDFTLFNSHPSDSTTLTHGRPLYVVNGLDDELWIGTNTGGVSRLDLETYRFTSYRHQFQNENSLGGDNVGGIMVDNKGIAWIGTNDYCLNKVDRKNGTIKRYYPQADPEFKKFSPHLGKIAQDPSDPDILWIGAPYGAYKFNKKEETFHLYRFTAFQYTYKPLPVAVYVDRDGIAWCGSQNGIVRIDPSNDQMQEIILRPAPYSEGLWMVSEIAHYKPDQLIIMTHHDGLLVYDLTSGLHSVVNDDQNLGHGSNFYYLDRLGNTWIATEGGALRASPPASSGNTLSLAHWPGYNWSRAFLPVANGKKLFVGTLNGAGLLSVDVASERVEAFPYRIDARHETDVWIRDLAWGMDSTIYMATDEGLLNFKPKINQYERIINKTGQYSWDDISTVCFCESILWFASQSEGLFAVATGQQPDIIYHNILKGTPITDLLCMDSIVIAGTPSGLGMIRKAANGYRFDMQMPNISASQLRNRGDTLWAGTLGQGLFRITGDGYRTVDTFLCDLGGSTNFIYHLHPVPGGIVWLNTDGGTLKLNSNTKTYTRYLELGVGKRSPIMQFNDGTILTGGNKSLEYYHPDDFSPRGIPPTPYLTKINIANRSESFDLAAHRIEHIELDPNEDEVIFEFDAINFNENSQTDYAFRLNSSSGNWQFIGHQKYINLNNLDAGRHTLEIKASNVYGGESLQTILVQIDKKPNLIARTWVQIALFIFFSGIFIGAILMLRRRKRNRLFEDTISYFSTSSHSENTVEEIIRDLSRNLVSRLKISQCAVYLADSDHSILEKKAQYPVSKLHKAMGFPESLPYRSVFHALDKHSDSKIPDNSLHLESKFPRESSIVTPIRNQDVIIGMLACRHHGSKQYGRSLSKTLARIAQDSVHRITSAMAKQEMQDQELRLLAIKKEVAELKLTALQAQMNPHFIFNSLNSINWYILKNKPAEASIYLTKFSKLVRHILNHSKSLTIPLDLELEALRLYLDLEAIRFENGFDYEILTDESIDLEEVMVPPLILQPFVENAIWHGLTHKAEKGRIIIQISVVGEHLKCVVEDDGIGRRASYRLKSSDIEKHPSAGIKLTSDRIRLLHDAVLQEEMVKIIDLVDHEGHAAGTRVEVMLPLV